MSNSLPTKPLVDIFLQPGEFYFGECGTRIRTLLGSCVAITVWHPRFRIGGMCHYLLAERHRDSSSSSSLDGRYAEDALKLFMLELNKNTSKPNDYVAKIFGGGDQFPRHPKPRGVSVPERNIDAGRRLLQQHGFRVSAEHLGGIGHRNLIFDISSGDVWVKHVSSLPASLRHRESHPISGGRSRL